MSWKTTLTILISANLALGLDAQYVTKGTPAPQDGYFLTVPKAQDLRRRLVQDENLKLINQSLYESIELYKSQVKLSEERVKVAVERNDELSKNLIAERSTSTWERIVWFSLGVIATSAAVWAGTKVSR